MKEITSDRGFQFVRHDGYPAESTKGEHRLVSQSSAIGELDIPGASFLWVDTHFHLDKAQVIQLRDYLSHWIETSKLF